MCGRYVRRVDKQRIAEWFQVRNDVSGLSMPPADYNITPDTYQPVIRENKDDGTREMVLMKWGLLPFYTKDLSKFKSYSTFNARKETIVISLQPPPPGKKEQPQAWREPMRKRRCLVPASAFYEWPESEKGKKGEKHPFAFAMTSGELFAFAGLWDAWKDGQGHWLQTFSIVTVPANNLMAPIHSRMPAILHSRDYDRWLSRETGEQIPLDLLRPFDSGAMDKTPANPLVGNVRNNGPEMLNSA